MTFTEEQIASLSPNPNAFSAGKKLALINKWQRIGQSNRALWGEIKGSGKKPYLTQVDLSSIAYKCTCPSRQFPCKHSIALMLIYANSEKSFPKVEEEPEWVQEWLDKRQQNVEKTETQKALTPEELQKRERNKEKTQADRLAHVMAGADDLELWLKDLVRIGLLELPGKPRKEFDKIAARMVDAKAPGLAGWVKALADLDYRNGDKWQDRALDIISKLYLLVKTIKNYNQLSPIWQSTIKSLAGWGQSTKDLLADENAEVISDHWLVLGQETEESNDIITQRNWLVGCNTDTKALILNFGTPFSTLETNLLPGTIIDADLAFFPSIQPHRAVVKLQRSTAQRLPQYPQVQATLDETKRLQTQILKTNPWANDHIFLLKNFRLFQQEDTWYICDTAKTSLSLYDSVNIDKITKCLAITGNKPIDLAFILRNDEAIPLGVFEDQQYNVL